VAANRTTVIRPISMLRAPRLLLVAPLALAFDVSRTF